MEWLINLLVVEGGIKMKRLALFLIFVTALVFAEYCGEATVGRFVGVWMAMTAVIIELLT